MEITQFTYFQQMGGIPCSPVSVELTYGLERLAMYIQGRENVYDLAFNDPASRYPMTYGDVFLANEQQQSAYNFEAADPIALKHAFETAEKECPRLLALGLILPAYEQAIGASHLFNLMDARGMIGVNERARTIGRIRALAKACCEAYTAQGNSTHG